MPLTQLLNENHVLCTDFSHGTWSAVSRPLKPLQVLNSHLSFQPEVSGTYLSIGTTHIKSACVLCLINVRKKKHVHLCPAVFRAVPAARIVLLRSTSIVAMLGTGYDYKWPTRVVWPALSILLRYLYVDQPKPFFSHSKWVKTARQAAYHVSWPSRMRYMLSVCQRDRSKSFLR